MAQKTPSTRFHDGIALHYDEEYLHPFWLLYQDISWEIIKKYLGFVPKGGLVLDAGGGTGYWSRKLASVGYLVYCVDLSEGMLRVGVQKSVEAGLKERISFVQADILELCFPDETFSLVFCEGDPVSYCGDPQKAVQELARVAKNGAIVTVSVDSFYQAIRRMVVNRDFRELEMLIRTHQTVYRGDFLQHNFTPSELRELFQKCGLEVLGLYGKPVFAQSIFWGEMDLYLGDEEYREKLLEIELLWNSEGSLVGFGGHLEIIGRKVTPGC